jgi:polar amino acid transport system substrate-binding protein
MKKVAKVLSLALAVGCVASMTGVATACNGEETLKIGYTIYAPMNYEDENCKFVGFDTEFAEKVCAELGYKAEFVEIVWETKVASLEAKEIDCIWNGMTITDELKEEILISDAYLENKQVLVMKSENASKFTSKASLANADSIAYETGSAADGLLQELTLTGVDMNGCEGQRDALFEVKTGASEVAVIDYTMAKAMTGAGTDYANLTFVEVDFPIEEYGIGFRSEDTELCTKVNQLIAKYKTDGTFDSLMRKYMA